ncbi:uncharacterized protein BP5553_01714 [Venustampulla echinocandica]|uniref:TLDc domain-containing protein n=1 Tax=Venustampulla echinocandica TaxID=2656787 RepID=A0A370U1U9_9HELO|nr:uncharacterized protein BP5553_01714 [Venustampulla echinocandica]RDL41735.1 hypothetical protein BP5553_01714 [Venustampulla echinocandica]
MGQKVSRERRAAFLTPVETQDQLQAKFAHYLVRRSREWDLEKQKMITTTFDEIFTKFSVKGQPQEYWNTASLVEFISPTLPADLRYIITDAAPILHRMVSRLGSYPYQTRTTGTLTLDVLRSAVIIIMLPYHYDLSFNRTPDYEYKSVEQYEKDLRLKTHRLLFQSLTESVPLPVADLPRNDCTDEDLIQALHALSVDNIRFWSSKRDSVTKAPPLPPALALPSSNSDDLTGIIPLGELRSLLRLLLLYQFTREDLDPKCESFKLQLEQVTDCVLKAFSQSDDEKRGDGVTWDSFTRTLTTHLPRIFDGLSNLFTRFLRAQEPQAEPKPKLSPKALGEPIICQLATFKPTMPPLSWRLPSYTVLDQNTFNGCVTSRTRTAMVLVSGLRNTTNVTFGILLGACSEEKPSGDEGYTCIFQLEPVHCVYFDKRRELSKVSFSSDGQNQISIKVDIITENSESVELTIENGKGAFVRKNVFQTEEGNTPITQHAQEGASIEGSFSADDIKFLGF